MRSTDLAILIQKVLSMAKAKGMTKYMVIVSLVKISKESNFPEELFEFISDYKLMRISNYKNRDDITRSLMGELLIRKLANEILEIPMKEICLCYNSYGKPYIANTNFHFNLSHSGEYVALAWSYKTIGIDIEKVDNVKMERTSLEIAKRFFTEREYTRIVNAESSADRINVFYQLWTLKESYVKALGKGLYIPLNSFEFIIKDSITIENAEEEHTFRFQSHYKKGYWLAVCHKEQNENINYVYYDDNEIYNHFLSNKAQNYCRE